jgi:hypothetical protein
MTLTECNKKTVYRQADVHPRKKGRKEKEGRKKGRKKLCGKF